MDVFRDKSEYRYVVLLGALVVVGLWLRVRNLGHLSLIVDEGVQALAIEAILEHGIPRMESGALYLRGPLYLYIQAALVSLFELNEFWLRFPGALFGTAAIVPAYILGKDLFNRPIGALSAIIIAISAWEIEMSRYARVYIVFQFFFLVSLIFFYRGFVVDEYRAKLWFLVAAFFAFLTHELSQVLGTLFLIPILMPAFGWRKKLKIGGWAVGLGGLLFVTRQFNGIYLPSSLSWASDGGVAPTGLVDQSTATLGIPSINGPDLSHFSYAVQHDFAAVLALLLVGGGATIYLFYRLFQNGKAGRSALGLLIVWAGSAYQFGLVLIFLVVYLALFYRGARTFTDRALIASLGAAAVSFVGWFVLLLSSPNLILVKVPLVMFGFPAFYKYLLRWLVRGWPVMTVLLAVGSISIFVQYLQSRGDREALFLLGALYVPALFASFFESAYVPVYTLHLYPLIVLIVAVVVWQVSVLTQKHLGLRKRFSKRTLFVLLIPVVLLVSSDMNPARAREISERGYQSERPPVRNAITFPFYSDYHPDLKGVSDYLKRRVSDGDVILVFAPNHMLQIVDFYVKGVDFWVTIERKERRRGILKEEDIIHYTSKCQSITSPAGIEETVKRRDGDVWMISDYRTLRRNNDWFENSKVKEEVSKITRGPDYVARDSITFIKRFPQ